MPTIDPATCPLCGAGNQCIVAQGGAAETCWCMRAEISANTLASIPDSLRNRACLCPQCACNGDTKNAVQTFEPCK